jgi:hypothetical protein
MSCVSRLDVTDPSRPGRESVKEQVLSTLVETVPHHVAGLPLLGSSRDMSLLALLELDQRSRYDPYHALLELDQRSRYDPYHALLELDQRSRYDPYHALLEVDQLLAALLELLSSSIGCYG